MQDIAVLIIHVVNFLQVPTSEVTPVTVRYIRSPHHGHTSQYHGHEWMTSFSFIVNRLPHSWDKTISDSGLETPRSRSWVWSKGKVIQSAQYHINSLPFHFTSIRPTIPEIELFRNLTLKHPRSRSWVRSKVKVTYCTQYPTNALPFCFTSIGPTISEIWPIVFDLEKTFPKCYKKIWQNNSFSQNYSKI